MIKINPMNRQKVLFVRAPNLYKSEEWKKQGVLRTPTNLAMLSSYIREFGNYEPEILDLELFPSNSIEQIANEIASKNARYIGFSTLSPRYPTILKICDELKKVNKKIITIVGGPHISGNPQDCKYSSIDYGIVGEGEQSLLDLLNNLTAKSDISNIENLVYKADNKIIVNKRRKFIENLDDLPMPAWDLMEMKEYLDPQFFGEEPHAGVFTSRGCPFDCIFCASKVTWQRNVRYRSIDNIMEEFTKLATKYGVKNMHFYDDQFAIKSQRAIELVNRMKDSNLGLRYYVQIRADSINAELAKALKETGCVGTAIGVETGNETMLKSIRKKETKDEIREAVRLLKGEGVPVLTSYIIGLPGDTKETIEQTLDFARELDTDQMKFMLLTPVPGTEVYDMAVKRGLLDPNNLEQMQKTTYYDSTATNLSSVTSEELVRYQDIAYRELDLKLDTTPKKV